MIIIVSAVCFFCDLCEYGSDDLFSLTQEKAAEKFVECIKTFPEDLSLVQSAGYGLGAIAKRAPKGHFSSLIPTLQIIQTILSQPDCRTDEDKVESTDNIIGALGKIVLFQFDGQLVNLAVLKEFLNLLPLYSDPDEAQAIHKLLFEQILASNPVLAQAEIVGDLKMCVGRIVRIANEKQELELLDDEGKVKAQQVISLMQ